MSLVVWLPLTKDLRQQGLSNVTVTNYGATLDNNGKLGKCYYFDGTDDAIGIGDLNNICPDGNFSFACWFYKSEFSSKGYDTIFGGPSGFELETKNGTTNSNVIVPWNWGKPQIAYEFDKWYHLVMTRTSSGTTYYLNGEQVATGTAGTIPAGNYFIGAWNTATQQNYKGKLNDVRIYNHCLSPMEVKELAKGLVLHYPLNRQGWGQENLLKVNCCSGGNRATFLENGRRVKINWTSNAGDTYWYLGLASGVTLTENKTYTLSFQCSGLGSNTVSFRWCNLVNYEVYLKNGLNTFTFAMPSTSITNPFFDDINRDTSLSDLELWNFKLEEGSIATPWCPNSSDTLATTMGLNSTTEYDCSGLCNNGTRTGAFSWTSDTPKYQVSTSAQGSSGAKIIGPGMPAEAKSAAIWVKCAKTVNSVFFADKNSTLECGLLNSLIYANTTNSAGFTTTHWKDNQWNHVVVVNDNGTRKVYVNGESETASGANNYYMHTTDAVYLWTRSDNNSYPFNGQMSDFRIYATALSANDVKSLYQNSAYIDSSGNVYGAVH